MPGGRRSPVPIDFRGGGECPVTHPPLTVVRGTANV